MCPWGMTVSLRTPALVAALAALAVVAAPAQALAPSGGTLTQITASTAEAGRDLGQPPLRRGGQQRRAVRRVPDVLARHRPGRRQRPRATCSCTTPRPGVVTLVSRTATGGSANSNSANPAISANGKFITFDSQATDLAGATTTGISGSLVYRYSVATGRIKLVSKTPSGALPASGAIHVRHQCHRPLRRLHLARRTTSCPATTTATGTCSATTPARTRPSRSARPSTAWRPTRPPTPPPSAATAGTSRGGPSPTNMGPADTNNDEDAYVSDVEAGTTTLISHDASGTAVGGRPTGISDNGKIVALTSGSDQLALQDTDNVEDAYVYNAATDSVRLISVADPGRGHRLGRHQLHLRERPLHRLLRARGGRRHQPRRRLPLRPADQAVDDDLRAARTALPRTRAARTRPSAGPATSSPSPPWRPTWSATPTASTTSSCGAAPRARDCRQACMSPRSSWSRCDCGSIWNVA